MTSRFPFTLGWKTHLKSTPTTALVMTSGNVPSLSQCILSQGRSREWPSTVLAVGRREAPLNPKVLGLVLFYRFHRQSLIFSLEMVHKRNFGGLVKLLLENNMLLSIFSLNAALTRQLLVAILRWLKEALLQPFERAQSGFYWSTGSVLFLRRCTIWKSILHLWRRFHRNPTPVWEKSCGFRVIFSLKHHNFLRRHVWVQHYHYEG